MFLQLLIAYVLCFFDTGMLWNFLYVSICSALIVLSGLLGCDVVGQDILGQVFIYLTSTISYYNNVLPVSKYVFCIVRFVLYCFSSW